MNINVFPLIGVFFISAYLVVSVNKSSTFLIKFIFKCLFFFWCYFKWSCFFFNFIFWLFVVSVQKCS